MWWVRRGHLGRPALAGFLLVVAATAQLPVASQIPPGATVADLCPPTCLPGPRDETSAAWFPGLQSAFLFGGPGCCGVNGTTGDVVRFFHDNATVLPCTLPSPRAMTSAVSDGTVGYVFGGADTQDSPPTLVGDVVRFDPVACAAGSGMPTVAHFPSPRCCTSAIWDGREAYIFGGLDTAGNGLRDVYRFTPPYDLSLCNRLPAGLSYSAAFYDGHGFAYVLGGEAATATRTVVKVDTQTCALKELSARGFPLPYPVAGASVAFDGSEAYLFGGAADTKRAYATIVKFDPKTGASVVLAAPSALPEGLADTSAVYDSVHHAALLFGGDPLAYDQLRADIYTFSTPHQAGERTTPASDRFSDWPMEGASAARTGRGGQPLPCPARAWVSPIGVHDGAPVVEGCTLFVGTDQGLAAVNASTGALLWERALDAAVESRPALGVEGVLATTEEGSLFLVDRAGNILWHAPGVGAATSPVLASGFAFFGTADGTLHAVHEATGREAWRKAAAAPFVAAPVAYASWLFYGANGTGWRAVEAANGAPVWDRPALPGSSFGAAAHGVAYVATGDGLHAFNASTGQDAWVGPSTPGLLAPAVAGGAIVDASPSGRLVAWSPSGTPLWSLRTGPVAAPAIDGGLVFAGSTDGHLYIVNETSGRLVSNIPAGPVRSTPAIANGMAYVSTETGALVAVQIAERGDPPSTTGLSVAHDAPPGEVDGFQAASLAQSAAGGMGLGLALLLLLALVLVAVLWSRRDGRRRR
ncbi:MAG: outer membrane protein assembly factor BamB family protein [Thermoplasmatota archaeon]